MGQSLVLGDEVHIAHRYVQSGLPAGNGVGEVGAATDNPPGLCDNRGNVPKERDARSGMMENRLKR